MQKVTYIRHVYDAERVVSDTPDVFSPMTEPHQDVLRYSGMINGESLIYTVGRQVFPRSCEQTNSPSRWTIIVVVDGELMLGRESLTKGDFVVIPSTHSYSLISKKKEVMFYWATTNDMQIIRTLLSCGYNEKDIMLGHLDEMKYVTKQFDRILYQFPYDSPCDHRVYLAGQLTSLIAYLAFGQIKAQRVSEQLFNRIISSIEHSYGCMTVEEISKHFFISRRYLYALFMDYKNLSPLEYIVKVRMQAAEKLLLTSEYSIAKIAELTGYSDYNHFTRAYKRFYGVLPSKRRKQARQLSALQDEQPTHINPTVSQTDADAE